MKVSRTDNSPTNITISVQADSGDLEPIRKHTLSHFKNVKVPGFRAGKAPAHLIEQHVSQQALLDEFMEHALNDLYRHAVEHEKIRPVSTPKVQLKKFVPYTELEFEAETEVLAPIKLPNYKAMKLVKKKPEVTANEVEDVLLNLQTRAAERISVDRPSKEGDEVIVDFIGIDSANMPVAGADGKDYPLILGSKTFIPGFEENLIGVKPDTKTEFEVTFPKDYGVAALQSKKVTFKVDVKTVSELIVPKIDDTFASKTGPFKTLKEMKADIKKQLLAEKASQAEQEYQNELVRMIADKSSVDVPKSLIENENLRLEEEEKRNLAYRGQTWQEHLRDEGVSLEQHRERRYPEALERVKIGLILNEIAEREKIQVTKEEVEIRRQILKGQYKDQQMQSELDKPENIREIESRLMTEKTLAKITGYSSK